MLRAMLVVALWCCAAVGARADVFVIAPPYYEGLNGQAISEELVRVVKDDLEKQHEIVAPKQAAALVAKEHRVSCPEGECAERYREAAGAVAAIVIRVGRAAGGAGPATSFQLGIQPAPGVEYTQGALLSDGPLRDIATKALREALRDYRQGPGPWLEVVGAPERASIFVDERAAGTLPWTDTLPLGTHRVRVEARGFAPMIKIVSLMSPTERKRLEFRLEPARASSEVSAARTHRGLQNDTLNAPSTDKRRATWRMVAGGTLAAGGLALVLWPLIARGSLDCKAVEDGTCTRSEQIPVGRTVGVTIAGAALAGAGAWLVVSGWRLRANPRTEGRVGVGPGGVLFRGSF